MSSRAKNWGLCLLVVVCALASVEHPALHFGRPGPVRSPASAETQAAPQDEVDASAPVGEIPETFQKRAEEFPVAVIGLPGGADPKQAVPADGKGLLSRVTDPLFGRHGTPGERHGHGGPGMRTPAEMAKIKKAETKRFEDWGLKLHDWVQNYVVDEKVPAASRVITLRAYFERIVHPWRTYLLAADVGTDIAKPLDAWQIDVPLELVPKDSGLESFLAGASGAEEPGTGISFAPSGLASSSRRTSFDPSTTLMRDVASYMRLPNVDNYTKALKTMTLSMAIQQFIMYGAHVGREEDVHLPQTCARDLREIPLVVPVVKHSKEERMAHIDGMIRAAGLSLSNNDFYKKYWLNFVAADPRDSQSFSGYLPLEKLRVAQRGLEGKAEGPLAPAIDDFDDFQEALAIHASDQIAKLEGDDAKLFQSMTKLDESGFGTEWLAAELQRSGKKNWEDLVPAEEKKLLQSLTVKIDLPPLDGADSWRRWGLSELGRWAQRSVKAYDQRTEKFGDVIMLCHANGQADCDDTRAHLQALADLLKPFTDTGEVLPKVRFDEPKLRTRYAYLSHLWTQLRETGRLDRPGAQGGKPVNPAVLDGWEMFRSQMNNVPPNPWAMLKLALTVEASREKPSGKWFGSVNKWERLRERLNLKLAIQPMHGNLLLSDSEKRAIWQKVVDANNSATGQVLNKSRAGAQETTTFMRLFPSLFDKPAIEDKRTGWERLEGLANRPVFTREQLDKVIAEFSITGAGPHGPLRKEIDEAWSSPDAAPGAFLYKIYLAQGNLDEQLRLLQEEGAPFGYDPGSETGVKEAILNLDLLAKEPLFRRVVVEGAVSARIDAQQLISRLCALDWKKDNEEFKRLVYSTMTVQKELNQQYGLPKPPKEFDDLLAKWFTEDKLQLKMGVAQGALAIGAVLALGSCMPPMFCVPALLMGIGAAALSVPMTKVALDDVDAADDREHYAETFRGQGFTDAESVAKFRNNAYGYAETVFNVVSALPMVGIPLRASSLSGPSVKAAVAVWARNGGLAETEAAVAAVRSRVNVSTSRYWIGADRAGEKLVEGARNLPAQADKALKSVSAAAGKLKALAVVNNLSTLEAAVKSAVAEVVKNPTARNLVPESVEEINGLFARTAGQEFGNDPKRFADFVRGFVKKSGNMTEYERRFQALAGRAPTPENESWLRMVWRRAHFEDWRQNRILKRMERGQSFEALLKRVEAVPADGLNDFMAKNADEISDFFHELSFHQVSLVDLPMRLREVPFQILGQGAPGIIKLPGARQLARASLLKEISSAREMLLYEKAKEVLQSRLGQKGLGQLRTFNFEKGIIRKAEFGKVYSDFRVAVLTHTGGEQALKEFEDGLNKRIWSWQRAALPKSGQYHSETLRQILFAPESAEDRVLAETIWGQVPKQVIFGEDFTVQKVASDLVRSLKDYKNLDTFEDYFAGLRMLVSMKLPDEIMN